MPIPQAAGDFVLFVTFGREQAGHAFDEWITAAASSTGNRTPQSLADRQVQQFISSRTRAESYSPVLAHQQSSPYTYLGRLAYHTHDLQRSALSTTNGKSWNEPAADLPASDGLTLRRKNRSRLRNCPQMLLLIGAASIIRSTSGNYNPRSLARSSPACPKSAAVSGLVY